MKNVAHSLFVKASAPVQGESGRIGYVIAWLMGVPASVLFFIFLLRGH